MPDAGMTPILDAPQAALPRADFSTCAARLQAAVHHSQHTPNTPDEPTRRVLMIAAGFPPTGGPGVQRSAKFARYLPQFGWTPTVWAADQLPGMPRDDSLLGDVAPDLDLHRFPYRDPQHTVRKILGLPREPESNRSSGWREACAWRLEKWLAALAWRTPPDPLIGWALRSYRRCRDLIERRNIDVIYSTYSPPSNHLLGWMLSRTTGLPWVADFRDLWTADYNYRYAGLRRRFDRSLERRFLTDADAVIGVTPSQTALLAGSAHDNAKFTTITNGLDECDFAHNDRGSIRQRLHGPADRFVLAFTGWFLSDRIQPELIDGLATFATRRSGHFELRIVGSISARMQRQLSDAGVAVTTTGYLPHDQAIEHMIAADALLLPVPPGPNGHTLLPGKTFEYLAAGCPILAIGSPTTSEVARMLREYDAGVCVEPDARAIEQALQSQWCDWEKGVLAEAPASEKLEPLTRRHLTGDLANVLGQARVRAFSPSGH